MKEKTENISLPLVVVADALHRDRSTLAAALKKDDGPINRHLVCDLVKFFLLDEMAAVEFCRAAGYDIVNSGGAWRDDMWDVIHNVNSESTSE